jgi:hypothetical protein
MEVSACYAHDCSRFPLTGKGIINLYALFSESAVRLISPKGRAGLVTPGGLATDVNMADFFGSNIIAKRLVSVYSFENKKRIFKSVQPLLKFALVTFGDANSVEFAFMLHKVEDLKVQERKVVLGAEDIKLLNPNTNTSPILRSKKDLDLVRYIYQRIPILRREIDHESNGAGTNSWGATYRTLYNMTSDSESFRNKAGLGLMPLYESKLFQIYDHRFSTFSATQDLEGAQDDDSAVDVPQEAKRDPAYEISTRYWVERDEVLKMLVRLPKVFYEKDEATVSAALFAYVQRVLGGGADVKTYLKWMQDYPAFRVEALDEIEHMKLAKPFLMAELKSCNSVAEAVSVLQQILAPRWLYGWRDVTDMNANVRTLISSVYPLSGSGHTVLNLFTNENAAMFCCLIAQQSSLACDYVVRTKIGGTHLSYPYMNQIPALPPSAFGDRELNFIVPRVLELVYTTYSLKGFYEDVLAESASFDQRDLSLRGQPFGFDVNRRAILRAELDAYVAWKWTLSREQLSYILDPSSVCGNDYPTETFRGLKTNELKEFGEYRTQRLVLEAWDRIIEPLRRGQV